MKLNNSQNIIFNKTLDLLDLCETGEELLSVVMRMHVGLRRQESMEGYQLFNAVVSSGITSIAAISFCVLLVCLGYYSYAMSGFVAWFLMRMYAIFTGSGASLKTEKSALYHLYRKVYSRIIDIKHNCGKPNDKWKKFIKDIFVEDHKVDAHFIGNGRNYFIANGYRDVIVIADCNKSILKESDWICGELKEIYRADPESCTSIDNIERNSGFYEFDNPSNKTGISISVLKDGRSVFIFKNFLGAFRLGSFSSELRDVSVLRPFMIDELIKETFHSDEFRNIDAILDQYTALGVDQLSEAL